MNKRVSGNYYQILTLLLVLSVVLLSTPVSLKAQSFYKSSVRTTNCPVADHQADRWYFGQNAGLDFRGQNPIVDPTNYYLNYPTSNAVMADSNGTVILFSQGLQVYDRQGAAMPLPDGNSLHGFQGNCMPVLIVPKPKSDSIYYVFTTGRPQQNDVDTNSIYGLEYSEVNMNRNNGRGAVTLENKVLLPPQVSSKLCAVLNSNGVDYWVVGHVFNSNEFCAFRVTENGVDTSGYVSSKIGTVQAGPGPTNNAVGYMKISPDGKKLAEAIHGLGIFEVYDFDASTGKVSNPVISLNTFSDAYGIAFSADSRYLYGSLTSILLPQPNYTPPSYLFQFDLNKGNSIFNPGAYDTLAIDTLGSYFGGMQLATDGRVYVSRSPYGNAAVSVIANPKRPGTSSNFTVNYIDLDGKKSRYGFPNFIQSYFDLPHFDVENVCYTDETIFTLQDDSNIDNVSWDFGDPSSGQNTSTSLSPSHAFSGPGDYEVQVTEYYGGVAYGPYKETVTVNELPDVNLSDTVYMYPGSPILLDAGPGFTSYEWSTGENSQSIKVYQPGLIYLTTQNSQCCFKQDSVMVVLFNVIVPNAFRPGGVNNTFKAFASSHEAINNFTMYIFNRWGQQLFISHDIDVGWDGTYKGKDSPGDVYVWLINYDVERSGKMVRIANKGNVILLR